MSWVFPYRRRRLLWAKMRWHNGSYSNLFPHLIMSWQLITKSHIMISSFLQFWWWSYTHFLQSSLITTFSKLWPNISLVPILEKQNDLLLVLTLTCKELRYYYSVLTTRKYWTNWQSMTVLVPIRELRLQEKSITQSKDRQIQSHGQDKLIHRSSPWETYYKHWNDNFEWLETECRVAWKWETP